MSNDDTMGSHETRSRGRYEYESSRSRRTPGPESRHGDRTARDERVPDDSFSSRSRAPRSRSPTKRSRSPDKVPAMPQSLTGELLTGRRHNPRPAVVDVEAARQLGSVSKKTVIIEESPRHRSQQAAVLPPATPPLRRVPKMLSPTASEPGEDESSSYYSEDEFGQAHPSYVSPLRVRKGGSGDSNGLQSYHTWGKSPSPDRTLQDRSSAGRSPQHRGLQKTATTGDLRHDDRPHPHAPRNYSPLSDYLYSQAQPVRKQMVGARGWLERTNTSAAKKENPEKKSLEKTQAVYPQQEKKRGFLNNLKKIAKDVTASAKDITSSASRKTREKDTRASRLTVSLDPREQSLLYCELEFLLTSALDGYINSQFNAGRLDADKYKKIVDGWQQRGRPKVVGWRYDLETQLDLVLLHSEDFRFYGKRAGLLAAVNGVLDMMRVDARAMRIRTFCQPDTVVAKQLLDAQSLFNLIGCCEQQQIQLAEVIQFFKVILEREQSYRRDEGSGQSDQDGQWHGSHGTGTESHSRDNIKST